jgi:signal transduction histidine kinase
MSRRRALATEKPERIANRAAHDGELELLQRLRSLTAQCKDGCDPDKLLRAALRLSLEHFAAVSGCVAIRAPGRSAVELLFSVPKEASWDTATMSAFLRGEEVRVPPERMFARIRRHGRMWGLLAIQAPDKDFRWDARQALSAIGSTVTELIERADHQRVREVRTRIDQKILEQLRPKDVFYQILHGLRSLTGYDHSAALLTCDNELNHLEVVAEQIAWCKAKSQRIGLKLPLTPSLRERLTRGVCFGFDHDGHAWRDFSGQAAEELAVLLDYNREKPPAKTIAAESAMLCAPLCTQHGPLGLLKVAALHPATFGKHEAELVNGFLLPASVALQNLRRTQSLEQQVIAAERKHAMADLARGVSHDVNNALGAVLPLVQQLRADLGEGEFEPTQAAADLEQVERSLQVCRRIFGGMLGFARGAVHSAGNVYLRHEVDCTLAILKEGIQRQNITLDVDIPADLPPICAVRADVEQLLLNLFSNSRDAMPQGGTLRVYAAKRDGEIEFSVEDTGCGIPATHLAKVQEPFFTTKPTGNGLGLSICRSIVSELRGSLYIESQPQQGTRVRVVVPAGGGKP